jgi:hypothetical protein
MSQGVSISTRLRFVLTSVAAALALSLGTVGPALAVDDYMQIDVNPHLQEDNLGRLKF